MRLKSMDGPLAVHNGNNVLNSPKRLNTLQNSNYTINHYANEDGGTLTTTLNVTAPNSTTELLNNINRTTAGGDVQWCNVTTPAPPTNNKNINNTTLAVTLKQQQQQQQQQQQLVEEVESPLTPDVEVDAEADEDSSSLLLETEEDDEEEEEEEEGSEARPFDSDTDGDYSDDGNNTTAALPLSRAGIVNPNYPGFQHLAHTLLADYGASPKSEGEEEAEEEDNKQTLNNNNNEEEGGEGEVAEGTNDKIDSVNRLDSVENIQKVFYDKPVFNITEELIASATNSNYEHDTTETVRESISCGNIVGNFGAEVEREFRIITSAVVRELEEACEKLAVVDLRPTATRYNIEPNLEQPLHRASAIDAPVLQDAITVKNTITNEEVEVKEVNVDMEVNMQLKLTDAFLSSVREERIPEMLPTKEDDVNLIFTPTPLLTKTRDEEVEKFCKEQHTKNEKEKDEDSAVVPPRKKEKIDVIKKRRDYNQQMGSLITIPRREMMMMGARGGRENINRRSLPIGGATTAREKHKKASPEMLGGFDVYNIETAMPKIDLEVIETHLRAAREEERRRRTDREEIRRRLAMGNEEDYYNGCDRPGRKPSLQARLQSGMNLQICFMNETASDTESPSSDSECTLGKPKLAKTCSPKIEEKSLPPVRPATLPLGNNPQPHSLPATMNETDFFAKQARLQTEARMALAQAKEMARMQMEIERQRQKKSPITEMVRHSMEKVGIPFPEDRRRLSRQILTEMNVAQLQVIVNDLHTQIEILNESLVKFLMARDDLHMEQDSMLVDIEDLTRFLGAKEQIIKEHNLAVPSNNNVSPPSPAPSSPLSAINSSVKPHFNRIASLVKK